MSISHTSNSSSTVILLPGQHPFGNSTIYIYSGSHTFSQQFHNPSSLILLPGQHPFGNSIIYIYGGSHTFSQSGLM